ncbi:hypothetical protein ACFSKL_11725 [Belliella marina]|uniref:MarR family transcriptional regulator n=1 Tax=Belliella marina TaxID=1644146 RepID=A0ABW4VPL8_9BACT
MENKNRYYLLLKKDNGQHNEIELGEKLGLDEDETSEIISQLLLEHRIQYKQNRFCEYKIMGKSKHKTKSNI